MTEGKSKILLIRGKKEVHFKSIIVESLFRNIFISLKYNLYIRYNFKLDAIIFKKCKYIKKPPTLHTYHAQQQLIEWRVGVNGQFSYRKKITMESQGDVFISDLKKRMSSEVTQFANLLRIMKARVMTKRCRRCSQGLGGKIAD